MTSHLELYEPLKNHKYYNFQHLQYFVSDSKDEPQGIGQEQAVCCT